jgi:hypothetical protein
MSEKKMKKTVSRFWGAEQAYLNATANTQEKTGASGNSPALSRHRQRKMTCLVRPKPVFFKTSWMALNAALPKQPSSP